MDPDKPPTKNRGEGIGRNKIPKSPSGNLEARHQAAQAHARSCTWRMSMGKNART